MRILNIHGVGDVRLDRRDPPVAGDHDVLVDVKACGICGSDLSYIKMGGIISKPLILNNQIIVTGMDGRVYCLKAI